MVNRLIGPTSRPTVRCSAYPDPTTTRIGTSTWAKTTKTADGATRKRDVVGYDTRRRSDGSPCTTGLAWSPLPAIVRHSGADRDSRHRVAPLPISRRYSTASLTRGPPPLGSAVEGT